MNLKIRVDNPKPIPGPSPLITMMRDNSDAHGFFCEANNECYSFKADDKLLDELPKNHLLANNPNGKVDHEWIYELFNFK